MANSLGDLIVKIGADISDYVNQLGKAQKQIAALGSQLEAVGARMSVAITAPMVGLGVAALKTAGQFEQNQIAFKTMLGSAENAKGMLQELSALAASSPFELQDTVTGARRLLVMGMAAKDVLPTMRTIGDAVSAAGTGVEGLNRVTLALGQMTAKGKISAEEINQLAEAGVKGWDGIAKAIGKTVPEAMKLAENGAISASVGIGGILEDLRSKFAGAMEAQNKTFLGQMSNLKDNITRTLGQIGEVLMPTAKAVVEMMQPMLGQAVKLARAFAALPTPVQQAAIGLVGLVAAVGPLVLITGTLASSVGAIVKAFQLLKAAGAVSAVFTGMTATLGPLGVALLAVGAAAAIVYASFGDASKAGAALNAQWNKFIADQVAGVKTLEDSRRVQTLLNKAVANGTMTAAEASKASALLAEQNKKIASEDVAGFYGKLGIGLEVVTKKTETLAAAEEIAAKKHKAFSEATLRAQLERVAALEAEGNHAAIAARKLAAFFDQMINGGDAIQDLADGLTLTVPKVIDVADAFKTLGVVSLEELQKTEEKAVAAFEAIKQSGTSSWLKITEAAIAAAKTQVATAAAMGKDVSAELATIAAAQAQVDAANGKMATSTATASQKMSKSMQVVSTAVTDLSRGIAEAIVHAKNLGDVFRKVAESMAEAVIRLLIEGALAKLGDKLIKLGGMWGKLGGAIGGGGSGGGGGLSIPGVSGGGGGAGGAVGGAAGAGVTGIVGAVAGVVSAVSGIIGNFQMMGMNKSLDLIEANTRFTQIGIIGPGGMLDRLNTYLPGLVGVQDRLVDVRGALFAPVASTLEGIYDRLGGGGKGGAGGGMTMNFYGVTDPRQMAEKIVASMKLAGVKV